MKKKVTVEEALQLQEMYNSADAMGRRVWTIQKLADAWDMGETTMYRIINGLGPYKNLSIKSKEAEAELDQAADESFKRLQEELNKNPEVLLDELVRGAETPNAPIGEEAKERAKRLVKD